MVVVDIWNWIWKTRLAFYPTGEEIEGLVERVAANEILRIRQTAAQLPPHPLLIERGRFKTSLIDLTQDVDAIYGQMHKSCRIKIGKLRQERLASMTEVRANGPQAREDFLRVFNSFVRVKQHQQPLSRKGFEQYAKVCDVQVVYYEGRAMCGHLLARDRATGRVTPLFSGSLRLQSEDDARLVSLLNRYLHWHEMRAYKSQGYALYDFGGLGSGQNPIAKFKLSFGGRVVEENIYTFAGPIGQIGDTLRKKALGVRLLRRR